MIEEGNKMMGKKLYVGVDRRFEFLDSTVGSNVFNAVTEGSFVKQGTTTTARLLFTTFRFHHKLIHAFCNQQNHMVR